MTGLGRVLAGAGRNRVPAWRSAVRLWPLLVAPAILVALGAILLGGLGELADRSYSGSLVRGERVATRLVEAELQRLELEARLLSRADNLSEMVSLAGGSPNRAVSEWLDGVRNDAGLETVALLDPEGRLLASSSRAPDLENDWRSRAALLGGDQAAAGVAAGEGGVRAFGIATAVRNFERLADVIVERRLDEQLLRSWADLAGVRLALVVRGGAGSSAAASTIDASVLEELIRAVDQGQPTPALELRSTSRPGRARTVKLSVPTFGEEVLVALWRPAQSAERGFGPRPLELVLVFAAALALGLLLALLWSRRRAVAIAELESTVEASFAESAAGREPTGGAALGSRSPMPFELRSLAARLETNHRQRRSRRELGERVALAEARSGDDRLTRSVPMRDAGAFLGIEVRKGNAGDVETENRQSPTPASDWVAATRSVLATCGGRLEGRLGGRLLAHFEGASGAHRALAAASQIGHSLSAGGDDRAAAVIVATGSEFEDPASESAPLPSRGEGPSQTGLELVERMLREAQPGEILITEAFSARLAAAAGESVQPWQRLGLFELATVHGLDFGQAARLVRGLTAHGVRDEKGGESAAGNRLQPGALISGRYQIWSWQGAGVQSFDYLAWDRARGRRVNVQELKAGVFLPPLERDRLTRGLALARRLDHPNILSPTDVVEHRGRTLVVSDLRPGLSLRAVLEATGRIPWRAATALGEGIAAALAAAHQVELCHFDLGPERIWLGTDGETRVGDFGVAQPRLRERGKAADGGLLVGGVDYLAPEQIDGPTPDPRTDVYSFGAVLYEAVTGRRPFEGEEPMAILRMHLEETPPPPRRWAPHLPQELEDLIQRCLAKSPGDRYQHGAEVLAAWRALQSLTLESS